MSIVKSYGLVALLLLPLAGSVTRASEACTQRDAARARETPAEIAKRHRLDLGAAHVALANEIELVPVKVALPQAHAVPSAPRRRARGLLSSG